MMTVNVEQEGQMQQFRQGDVFLEHVSDRVPQGQRVTDGERVILAYGEVTGHVHEVIAVEAPIGDQPSAQFFEEPDGTRYLFVTCACLVTHQEHGAIQLAPGCYKVTRQREYSPEEIRQVAD